MFLKSPSTRKVLKSMKMANWTWVPSEWDEREAFRELKQMAEGFIEMNDDETVKFGDLTVLWYPRGLGDQYATAGHSDEFRHHPQ